MAKLDPNRTPKPAFKTLKQFNRHKRILLGLPVERSRNEVPWGYSKSPENPDLLLPNEAHLRLLLKAKEYLRTCSLQEVARWLSEDTKCSISAEGVRLILSQRCPFEEIMLDQDERERLYRE